MEHRTSGVTALKSNRMEIMIPSDPAFTTGCLAAVKWAILAWRGKLWVAGSIPAMRPLFLLRADQTHEVVDGEEAFEGDPFLGDPLGPSFFAIDQGDDFQRDIARLS